jgi:hypothetical protein
LEYIAIETRVMHSIAGMKNSHVKATTSNVTPVYVKIDPTGNEKIAGTVRALHELAANKIAALALRCELSDVVAKNVFASSASGYSLWVAFNKRGR